MTIPTAKPTTAGGSSQLPQGTYVDLGKADQHINVTVEQEVPLSSGGFPGARPQNIAVFCERCTLSYQLPSGCGKFGVDKVDGVQ